MQLLSIPIIRLASHIWHSLITVAYSRRGSAARDACCPYGRWNVRKLSDRVSCFLHSEGSFVSPSVGLSDKLYGYGVGQRVVWELFCGHAVGRESLHRNSLFSLFVVAAISLKDTLRIVPAAEPAPAADLKSSTASIFWFLFGYAFAMICFSGIRSGILLCVSRLFVPFSNGAACAAGNARSPFRAFALGPGVLLWCAPEASSATELPRWLLPS